MNFEAAAVVGSDGDIVDDTSKPRAGGVYTPLSPALLPELYLVYNIDLGGDSGKVHATVKERWLRGDAEVTEGEYRIECGGGVFNEGHDMVG